MNARIVVLDAIGPATAARMRALLPPGFSLDHAQGPGEAEVMRVIADAEYAITGFAPVTAAVLRAAPRLRLLHKWGVGTDNFDLDAARASGVTVARTTGSNAAAVSEFTIGLIIATLRHLAWAHAELRDGRWRGDALPGECYLLSGKTVGVVGFGAIGRRVARLVQAFGCRVIYVTPRRLDPAEEAALDVVHAPLAAMLREADVVCLHCPLTEQTRGLIDRAALTAMKPSAVLINMARGGIVVEADLIWALQTGVIHGAGMDVFETEPPSTANPLLSLPNAVVTPHIAAGTADSFVPTVGRMFDNIQRVASGRPVNPGDVVVPGRGSVL